MKRTIAMLLALTLCVCLLPCGALAAEFKRGIQTPPVQADLDGDGTEETLQIVEQLNEDGDSSIGIDVIKNGQHCQAMTDIRVQERLLLSDMDGDGLPEILLTGDEMSDDYLTRCWRYRDGQLQTVPFESGDVLYCGVIDVVTDNLISVFATVDALGTYTGFRYISYEDGAIRFADEDWTIGTDGYTPELTVKQDIYVLSAANVDGDGSEETLLEAGTKILLGHTDGRTYVTFVSDTILWGTILLEEDEWGSHTYVNGLPEEDVFEGIEYAD